jgi:SAM-dependent methyltransferase
MHQSSIDKMTYFKDKYLLDRQSEQLVILDLGSQNIGGSYKPIFDCENWRYVGVDLAEGENVDVVLQDAYQWNEIQSNSIDVLISGQTLEHVEYFWITIMEIVRVMKPGGLCCMIAPSSGYEHRYPVDCWRFYPDGMRAIAQFAKLEVLETFTQWKDEEYADGSNVWHDSVLIASKSLETDGSISASILFNERYVDILTERGQIDMYRLQLLRSQSDVENIQNKLYQADYYTQQSQAELAQSQAKLAQSQAELAQSQAELAQSQAELAQSQAESAQSQAELAQSRQCIDMMQRSKFWHLRNIWFKIKSRF